MGEEVGRKREGGRKRERREREEEERKRRKRERGGREREGGRERDHYTHTASRELYIIVTHKVGRYSIV